MTEPSSSFTKLVRRDVGSSLIFLAEGYAAHERDAFLGDVRRLYDEVLGSPDAPLRHPSRWSYDEARERCGALHERPALCDRGSAATLVLLANDPYYGGLGDDVIIATASKTSGALALRHELGHVLGDVGEEYDGADYSGPNFSLSAAPCGPGAAPRTYETTVDGIAATRTIWPCAPWLERNASVAGRTALALAAWPFAALRVGENRTFAFASDLDFAKLEFSVSGGVGVDAYVDGVRADVAYKTPPTADRRRRARRARPAATPRRDPVGDGDRARGRRGALAPGADGLPRPGPRHGRVQRAAAAVGAFATYDDRGGSSGTGRRSTAAACATSPRPASAPSAAICCCAVASAGGLFGRRGSGLAPTVAEGAATRWFRQDLPGGAYAEDDPAARRPGCWRRRGRSVARGPLDVFESSATVAVDAPWCVEARRDGWRRSPDVPPADRAPAAPVAAAGGAAAPSCCAPAPTQAAEGPRRTS
ncbi:IgA peptidase M64 [Aureococcus anophagefferens]|nr:IgA peptidase M64 [Aureococcus anophagefferens]